MPAEINATFAERFKEMIGDEPYRSLRDRLSISITTISAYVNGDRTPKTPVLKSLCAAYGVNELWLMGFDYPKYKETPKFRLEDLSPEQLALAQKIANATPEQVRALTAIVDQVLALRG